MKPIVRTARQQGRRRDQSRRAFTLLEAMIATSILLGVVTAVTAAIVSGQQHAYEAQQRVAATLAAEALLSRVVAEGTPADLIAWHGYVEQPGTMTDAFGNPLPSMYDSIGRRVHIASEVRTLPSPQVTVAGHTITVEAFDAGDRALISLSRFVPEQQAP